MEDHTRKPLNIASIAGLWSTYMSDSASICVFKYFLNTAEDKEIKKVIQQALDLSEQHIKVVEKIFNEDNITIPDAFGEGDVDISAPRLFSDSYYLFYISTMSGFGMDAYSLMIRNTSRADVENFFVKCLNDATGLLLKASALEKEKGIYLSAPRMEISPKITYIERETFFAGLLGKPRPLLVREVANIFAGELVDIFWRALFTGFGQVTATREVKDFMFKGIDIASAHYENFSKLLNDEDIPVPGVSDIYVTNSTTAPFSDKLIMFLALSVCAFVMSVDGASIASSMRSDLIAIYTKLGAEVTKYASEGMEIMINNRWMEQPPQVVRHESLSTVQ